jgi:hypothetical protein
MSSNTGSDSTDKVVTYAEARVARYKNMKTMFSTDKQITLQGKKLTSLYITYNSVDGLCAVEVSSAAERVSNYFRNRYGVTRNDVVLPNTSPAAFLEIAKDMDDFITMLYA